MPFRVLIVIYLSLLSDFSLSAGVDTKKISKQMYLLKGQNYNTNIGLISTDEGLVLIDPMPGKGQLDELNKTVQAIYKKPIAFILNTHEHTDHSGGNEFFTDRGSKLIRNNFDIAGLLKFKVTSHSQNDLIYYHVESNSIFVGDVFDSSWHPTFYAGGLNGFNMAVDTILSIGNEDSLIIPGHGNPTNKVALRDFKKNTVEWFEKVMVFHREGKSVQKIMEAPEIDEIVKRFNLSLPKKALRRFIERTISLIERDNDMQQTNTADR
ncbi:MBL fold metallo-hydrolase [Microbulbifer hainanensis]|uniref:MBL fold metallo-hydrolase n=1 Tax=Microbulbifer hainanensis TaxID=2735675 RepID=UPI001866D6CC|nr:MBL fold metallo-hydrolase [Microbulbifer hainanensis]